MSGEGMQVALFVEGGQEVLQYPTRRQAYLQKIWNGPISELLGVSKFSAVYPISKKHIIAMDPDVEVMSGCSEGVDKLMVRMRKRNPFDAAVVAWDLVPDWNSAGDFCRRKEVLRFYQLLAGSQVLPEEWRKVASDRHDEVRGGLESAWPMLSSGMVLAICMEPMFEQLMMVRPSHLRKILQIDKRPPEWPRKGWGKTNRKPDVTIGKAVDSLFAQPKHSRPKVCRIIGREWSEAKDEWGEYILRGLCRHRKTASHVRNSEIATRLMKWLPKSDG